MRKCTRPLSVLGQYAAVDSEYERLRTLRRRAERHYPPEACNQCQKIPSLTRPHLQTLDRKRWGDFCRSLSQISLSRKIWSIIRSFEGSVTQSYLFRAVAVVCGDLERTLADEFCQMVIQPGAETNRAEYRASADLANQKVREKLKIQHSQRDCFFAQLFQKRDHILPHQNGSWPGHHHVFYA